MDGFVCGHGGGKMGGVGREGVRGSACLWVCFGPLEGCALWLECVEVV